MKRYLLIWIIPVVGVLLGIGIWVSSIDPFFRYHMPETEKYFYVLDNQRSQNNGILSRFDYDAIITGTSMTENFRTSEFGELFGVNAVKASFSGGSFKEVHDNLKIGLESNPNVRMVIRGLDMTMIMDDKDEMHDGQEGFPYYLFDDNPFNDVKYIYNRDIVFDRAFFMEKERGDAHFTPGITSFDEYSNWSPLYPYGRKTVCPSKIKKAVPGKELHLTPEVKERIEGNISQNVTSLAIEYPDVEFYCFIPPYSIEWWRGKYSKGTICMYAEAVQYAVGLMLEFDNIHLFSFNDRTDITTDLNHYKDYEHYGGWVNSLMLKWMHDGRGLLTKDNYEEIISNDLSFYQGFDYTGINDQDDYENDLWAAALVNQELTGAEPLKLLETKDVSCDLRNARQKKKKKGSPVLICKGRLDREPPMDGDEDEGLADYLLTVDHIGAKYFIPDAGKYNYAVFYGRKIKENGEPSVFAYDSYGNTASLTVHYNELDTKWHEYILDISKLRGDLTLIFNGGYLDSSGSEKSEYAFRDIVLY